MINDIKTVIKEQWDNRALIFRISNFEMRGMYTNHYLGSLWEFITPLLQVVVYWMIFGLGIRGGDDVDGTPFILWLLMGLIPWFLISPSIIQASNSVYQKIGLVSKMKFPVSLLPTISIINNVRNFIVMMLFLFIILAVYGIDYQLHLIQLIYYLFALFAFLFSFSIFSSTLATIVRDYQLLLQSIVRMLFFLTPILWDVSGSAPDWLKGLLQLNPFYYIIDGIRASFLGRYWFFEQPLYFFYFWTLTFAILFIGSKMQVKFKKDFVEYL
jgi:teichoic acid transport system permease protein